MWIDGSGYYIVQCIDYCNNPSEALPLMLKNKIGMEAEEFMSDIYHELVETGNWEASPSGASGINVYHVDENPLRVAMICFLEMQEIRKEII